MVFGLVITMFKSYYYSADTLALDKHLDRASTHNYYIDKQSI